MLGAAGNSAFNGGIGNMQRLLALDQARKQMQQQALSNNLIGNYLQQVATQPQAPSPGQSSTPSAASTPPSPAQETTQPAAKGMSLDGLMKYMADRGITGEQAWLTAQQYSGFMSEQDKNRIEQGRLNMDLQKLLVQYGYDQQRAKDAADRIAAYDRRTKAMQGRQAQQNKVAGLNRVSQQLTTGRQQLEQQRANIVNTAKNQNRALTAQEQAAIDQLNTRIQTVDNGIKEVRKQQAGLQGVDEAQYGNDSIMDQGPDTDYLAGGDSSGGP